jgi:hypothetical protein
MEITNTALIGIRDLFNTLNEKKTPFSTTLIKNNEIINSALTEYNKNRTEIIDNFILKTENGSYLGKIIPESNPEIRYENSNKFDELEIEDREGLYLELNKFELQTIEINFNQIDINKKYFDNKLEEKSTYEDYINSNFDSKIIQDLVSLKIIVFS